MLSVNAFFDTCLEQFREFEWGRVLYFDLNLGLAFKPFAIATTSPHSSDQYEKKHGT